MKILEFQNTKHVLGIPVGLLFTGILQWFGFFLNIDGPLVLRVFLLFLFSAAVFDNRLVLRRWITGILKAPEQVILAIPSHSRTVRNRLALFDFLAHLPYGRQAALAVAFIWVSSRSFLFLFVRLITSWLFVISVTSITVWIHIQYVASTVEFLVLGISLLWFMAIRSYRVLSTLAICVAIVLLAAVVYTRIIMYEVLTDKLTLWAYIFLCIGVIQKGMSLSKNET